MKLKYLIVANVAALTFGIYSFLTTTNSIELIAEKASRWLIHSRADNPTCLASKNEIKTINDRLVVSDICSSNNLNQSKGKLNQNDFTKNHSSNFVHVSSEGIVTNTNIETNNNDQHKHGGTFVNDELPVGDIGSASVLVKLTGELPSPAHDGVGAFRTVCKIAKYAWDDPIVYPNMPGVAHLHMFWGNTGVNASSTHESLRESGNSTCRGGAANRTSYWIPTLLTSDGHIIQPKEVHSYYKRGYNINKFTELFTIPEGLKMISGDMYSTHEQNVQRFNYKCWNKYTGLFSKITGPKCSSDDYLSINIAFPQCWDGKNIDSNNHKNHMAWPEAGRCPSSHPITLPEVSAHVLYKYADIEAAGKDIHLSSDMYPINGNGGYSLHADFFEAWDREIARTFTQNCLNKNNECHSHLLGDGRIIQ